MKDCLTEEMIMDYLYGESTIDFQDSVVLHTDRCESCRSEIQQMAKVMGILDQWEAPSRGSIQISKEQVLSKSESFTQNEHPFIAQQVQRSVPDSVEISSQANNEGVDRLESALDSLMEKASLLEQGVFDIAALATYLKVHEEEIIRNLNEIPHFSLFGKIRFRKESVDAWLAGKESSRKQTMRDHEEKNQTVIHLYDFLRKDVI